VAYRLSEARQEEVAEVRDLFLRFWVTEGSVHFRHEEESLLPAVARSVPPSHAAVVRALIDHVEIRRQAADLEQSADPGVEALRSLGEKLRDHIRHEERVLFPLIEACLTPLELERLAETVSRGAALRT
jgi:hypothetical protein